MKIGKSRENQRICVPVRLFRFPNKAIEKTQALSSQDLLSKNSYSYSKQNSLKTIKQSLIDIRLNRSNSSKSISEKPGNSRPNNFSFIDLKLEDCTKPKLSRIIYPSHVKKPKINKNTENDPGFSISIQSFYQTPGVYTPAALIKRPILIKKTSNYFERSMQDWVIFNTISLSKPLNQVCISRSSGKIKVFDDTKQKKMVQAWIPQPTTYCKSPITVLSDVQD